MPRIYGRIFLLLLTVVGLAIGHVNLNGTWVMVPTRSDFAGEPVLQTGTVTIGERQHNMYISRTFNYDGDKGGFDYNFTTDSRENSTIHKGKTFKSKAGWEGDVLKVTTTRDGMTTVERFRKEPDGGLTMTVERPDHRVQTLVFRRQ